MTIHTSKESTRFELAKTHGIKTRASVNIDIVIPKVTWPNMKCSHTRITPIMRNNK